MVRAAAAIVFHPRTGRVLLVRRGRPPSEGEWTLPGGKLEPGETPFACAQREAREETGLEVTPLREVCLFELRRGPYAYDIHEILCEAVDPDAPLTSGDDAADARWFAQDELSAAGVRSEAIDVISRARG